MGHVSRTQAVDARSRTELRGACFARVCGPELQSENNHDGRDLLCCDPDKCRNDWHTEDRAISEGVSGSNAFCPEEHRHTGEADAFVSVI